MLKHRNCEAPFFYIVLTTVMNAKNQVNNVTESITGRCCSNYFSKLRRAELRTNATFANMLISLTFFFLIEKTWLIDEFYRKLQKATWIRIYRRIKIAALFCYQILENVRRFSDSNQNLIQNYERLNRKISSNRCEMTC